MPIALAVAVTFICAAASDELACRWQSARERRAVARGVWLALAIEAIGWVPTLLAIDPILDRDAGALAWIVAASLAGSAVGSARGFLAEPGREPDVRASNVRANLDG